MSPELTQALLVAQTLGTALAAIATALALVTLGKYAFGRVVLRGVKLDEELFIRDNPAAAILVLGYGGALLTAAVAVVATEGKEAALVTELGTIVVGVGAAALLVAVGSLFLLRFELSELSLRKAVLEDRNVGVALAAAGAYMAQGFLVHGLLAPEEAAPGAGAAWTADGALVALGFFAVAQVPLVLAAIVYRKLCGYEVTPQLARGNAAAGLSYGGYLAATGAVIGHAARGEFHGWQTALVDFACYALFGLVLLPSLRFATSAVLVPNSSLTHEVGRQDVPNWGAGLLEAFAYLGAAALVCHA